jgi:hypothetical protein
MPAGHSITPRLVPGETPAFADYGPQPPSFAFVWRSQP